MDKCLNALINAQRLLATIKGFKRYYMKKGGLWINNYKIYVNEARRQNKWFQFKSGSKEFIRKKLKKP